MSMITTVIGWCLFDGDIGQNEQALMMVIVPSLSGVIMVFITGETFSDHSARKNSAGS